MDFIDLVTQQQRVRRQLDANIRAVLAHGHYIMGPEIKKLEDELSGYTGCRHALACASGTDALLLALMAYGIGPGDAVFTTPFTFVATGEVIRLLGATPVFVDVDPRTFNMDPLKLAAAVNAVQAGEAGHHPIPSSNDRTPIVPRGIIAVDLFGLPADYDAIKAISNRQNLFIIEDAAQSFGAQLNDRKACRLADVGCTSFFPAKPLGCYGDGGMCCTDDDRLAAIIDSLRVHGKGSDKYDNVRIGINGRMDTLQAAILLAKFEIFPEEVELRQKVAANYQQLLSNLKGVQVQHIPSAARSAWAQFSILAPDRNRRERIQQHLKSDGIPTAVYYPKPLHLQTAFASLGYREGDFPVSEDLSSRIFSIPMHPYLKPSEQEKIIAALARCLE